MVIPANVQPPAASAPIPALGRGRRPVRPSSRRLALLSCTLLLLGICAAGFAASAPPTDLRNIRHGQPIPLPGLKYADQPYTVALEDGRWLCVMSVGTLGENTAGTKNYSVAFTSSDQGWTWSDFVPCNIPYAVPLRTDFGRVYTITPRYFSFSEDQGRSWSERIAIPACPPQSCWNVGLPLVHRGVVYVPWAEWNDGSRTVVRFYRSDNVLTERDAQKVHWEMFGELKGPDWHRDRQISEEPHLVALGDGTFYCVFRTDQGYICQTTSSDQGATWSTPRRLTYEPGGHHVLKNPRACPSLWKCANGKYLLWFHNNGTRHWYERNPGWISGGVERDGEIVWSQPEIVMYADEIAEISGRISYPGLLEANGRYFISETSKVRAGVHEINPDLLQQVWSQHERRTVTRKGLKAEFGPGELSRDRPDLKFPAIPDMIRNQGGFTIDLWLEWADLSPGQVLLDNRDARGSGIVLRTNLDGALELTLGDSKVTNAWTVDRNVLQPGRRHHIVAIADGGPKVILFVVDGVLCDGGAEREFGWGRFSPFLQSPNSDQPLRLAPRFRGRLTGVRLYNRAVTVSEAIGNFRAGPAPSSP